VPSESVKNLVGFAVFINTFRQPYNTSRINYLSPMSLEGMIPLVHSIRASDNAHVGTWHLDIGSLCGPYQAFFSPIFTFENIAMWVTAFHSFKYYVSKAESNHFCLDFNILKHPN
jgi:hypothetical protein